MKRTVIEKLILAIAWIGLVGGVLFTFLVSKGIIESNQEMCVPQAAVTFIGGVFVAIAGWALLIQIVRISDKLRNIDNQLKESKNNIKQ